MGGIFGVFSQGSCAETLFYGTDYLSHLGGEYAGLAVWGKDITRKIHYIGQDQFKSKFEHDYKNMAGNKGIGVISSKDEQPIFLNSKFGPFIICTNGLIENLDELAAELYRNGVSFSELVADGSVNATELIAKLINQGNSILDGIEKMFTKIKGSCSLLLLTREGIYAARDRLGYTPLVVGEHIDPEGSLFHGKAGSWAISSETTSFHNTGFKITKYLQPDEIIFINESGIKQVKAGGKTNQICAFLWIYTGFPASSYEGINVEIVRERCGQYLARNDNVAIDLVTGIPDSGTTHAIGYALESGKPYRRPLVKYTPGYGRSYTPPSQEVRDLIAKMKLVPIKELIQDMRMVVCEDSIVRGTQLKNFTIQKLWENGAKEIHIRPACPPLMWPCKFNLSTRSLEELAARKAIKVIEGKQIEDLCAYLDPHSKKYQQMVEWIAKDLGVTSLKYQTIDNMVKAIGLPREKLCLYCWTGKSLS